jgi:kanamycin nucleotidyltransferase
MVSVYGDGILLCGLYGSTARGADLPSSDLEMVFVTQEGCKAEGRNIIFRGTAAGYQVTQRPVLEKKLATPSLEWPFLMGVYSVVDVIHGDEDLVEAWLRIGRSIPLPQFHRCLEKHLPALVVESCGRIHSCVARGNLRDLDCAVIETTLEMNLALCLLNGRWVTHDYYQGFVDAFDFPLLPARYAEIISELWRPQEPARIVALAEELASGYWELLIAQGVDVRDYQSLDELPV